MNVSFQKQGDVWVAEATITDVCALHVERVRDANFTIRQSSVQSGKYAPIMETVGKTCSATVDTELVANIYPKYLRFESASEVVSAVINY